MASVHFSLFGIIVEFDHLEITQIASHVNTGAAASSTISGFLAAQGVTGAVAAAIVSGLFWLGSAWLLGCNSQQQGIVLHVLWVGVPWCISR